MQSLWARAGQAHRCGCRACSTAVGAVGRRATGAAGRRKATFAEVFTACYSSVFATAAIVDAVRKDDRRKELDRQLEEARRELSELQERGASASSTKTEANSTDLSIQQMDSLWKSLKIIYRNRPFMKEIDKPATITASELIDGLKTEYYNAAGEPLLNASRKTNYEQLERAILAEEGDGRISFRESQTQAQLLRESLSIEHLVQQLLNRAELFDEGITASPSFDEARGLAAKGYPKFSFRSVDPDKAAKNTSALNNQIRSLVDTKDLSLREKIGRVCYNLLISAHPPDMHTYNTLIVAFDKCGQHAFSDALVHSFFHGRLLKPTPSTFTAILNHYKATNNHGQFLRGLACLTGLDGKTGGKMRRRHVSDIEHWGMQKWAGNSKLRTCTGNWVWDHVPLNLPLAETILTGLLQFKLFDDAASFFLSCMRSGVALSARTVKHLFDECVAALDWRAAVTLVRGLSNSLKRWEVLLLQENNDAAAYLVGRIFALIDLSGLGNNGQEPSEKCLANLDISGPKLTRLLESLSKATLLLPEVYSGSFQAPNTEDKAATSLSKSRLLQLESMWKEYEFVRKTTASIESKLLYPEFSSVFRGSMAIHIGAAAMQRSLILCQELEDILPPNGSLSRRSDQCLRVESLANEMGGMTVIDEWVEDHEEPRIQEVTATSMAATGWAKKQDQYVRLHRKPSGLLTWQRPTHRTVYAEGRQWAVGT